MGIIAVIIFVAPEFARGSNESSKIPKDLKIAEYFTSFGSFNGWGPLHDQKNNPILNCCLRGATESELKALGINDLQERLTQLEQVNLIEKAEGRYQLAFPAIVGQKRVALQKYAEQVAKQLLPFGERMIEQIRPYLQDREEMLYHVLWSDIMDMPIAWNSARVVMNKQVESGDTSIDNKVWLLYPSHRFRVGTNYYSTSSSSKCITWNRNTPRPNTIHRIISRYESDLVDAVKKNCPIKSVDAKESLSKYGLVDKAGRVQIYTLESNSKEVEVYMNLGTEFGQQTMNYLDVPKVAVMLDVSPGMAFVIAYHEVCWQLLQDLVEKKVLTVPNIVAKADADPKDAYQLVSLIMMSKVTYPFLETEMSQEEKATIKRFNEIKKKILSGEKYFNLSTPVDGLLSYISAVISKNADTCRKTKAVKMNEPIEFEPDLINECNNICIYRTEPLLEKPKEGDIHPIYITYIMPEGKKSSVDVQVFIYHQSGWRKLFNNGNVLWIDWRRDIEHMKSCLK